MPSGPGCNLRRTPTSLDFDFEGSPGRVTLEVEGTVGTVAIIAAKYDGEAIAPLPATEITFTIVSGISHLSVVYAFSDTANGKGTLKEKCASRTRLIDVRAGEPAVLYRIRAKLTT